MSAYHPMPTRGAARRVWLAEISGCVGFGLVVWLCGRLLEDGAR